MGMMTDKGEGISDCLLVRVLSGRWHNPEAYALETRSFVISIPMEPWGSCSVGSQEFKTNHPEVS